MPKVEFGKLTSMHFYAWKKGLKTGMYYLRTKGAADAIKFTLDTTALAASGLVAIEDLAAGAACARENKVRLFLVVSGVVCVGKKETLRAHQEDCAACSS